jgi:membrane protease YdiL (CAAX protease family)
MSRSRIELGFLLIALVWPAAAAWLYFVATAPDRSAVPVLYSAGKVVQFSLPLVCWAVTGRTRFRLQKPTRAGLASGAAFGFVLFAATLALYFTALKGSPFLSGLDVQVRLKVLAMGLDSRLKYVLFVLFLSLIHSGLEEYYWRAFVFGGFRHHLPVAAAVAVSSLGFMAHHVLVLRLFFPDRFWTAAVPLSLTIAVGGAVWAYQYDGFKSVYPAWVGHALVDLAIVAVGYDLVFSLDN